MLPHHDNVPRIASAVAIIVAFISLLVGITVRGYTTDMLQESLLVWSAAGAQTGFLLAIILLCTWIEDDPCGVLKLVAGATIAGAVLVPLLVAIGWVEWQVIDFWWPSH